MIDCLNQWRKSLSTGKFIFKWLVCLTKRLMDLVVIDLLVCIAFCNPLLSLLLDIFYCVFFPEHRFIILILSNFNLNLYFKNCTSSYIHACNVNSWEIFNPLDCLLKISKTHSWWLKYSGTFFFDRQFDYETIFFLYCCYL